MLQHRVMIVALLTSLGGSALAGPLSPPPGPIAPTMKTLAEVESRTAINSVNTPGNAGHAFRISASGSYYLTADLVGVAGKHGIMIDADDVTIDLNGFTIRGVPNKAAIVDRNDEMLPVIRNLTLRNGTVTGWSYGVLSFLCQSGTIENVTFRGNSGAGVDFNGVLTLRGCRAEGGSSGFKNQGSGLMIDCVATGSTVGFSADDSVLENCVAKSNSYGFVVSGGLMRSCSVFSASETGITLYSRATAIDCTVNFGKVGVEISGIGCTLERTTIRSTSGHGVRVALSDARIVGCSISGVGPSQFSAGIMVEQNVPRSHIENNSVVNSSRGIIVLGVDSLVIGNRVGRLTSSGNTYYAVTGNRVGPVVQTSTSVVTVSVNSGSAGHAGNVTTSDPNANISY